jgi:hypothetical protein
LFELAFRNNTNEGDPIMADTHAMISKTLDRMMVHTNLKGNEPRHADRATALKNLSAQLGVAKTEWDKLKNPGAISAQSDSKDYERVAEALAKGLPEIENGIIDVIKAFKGGDEFSEAELILNICASMVSTFGAFAGPEGAAIGKLVGSLLDMISTILGLFEPKKPSLLAQIETLLKQQQAEAEVRQLKGALEDFEAFEDAWKAGYWREVNLQNGSEVKKMREACVWLTDKDNQTDELRTLWFQVLDTQCRTFIEVVKTVPLALDALDKQDITPYNKRNAAGLLTVGLATTQRMQLAFLKEIVPVLQDRGIFWYLGTNGAFYVTDHCTDIHGKPNPGFRRVGGGSQTRMALAISKADKGKANPRLHVFSLGGGRIHHGRLTWPSGGLEEFKDLPVEAVAGCSDIWATYGANNPEDSEKVYFYTAHGGKELRGYILGFHNDKQENRIIWQQPVDKVTGVSGGAFPEICC